MFSPIQEKAPVVPSPPQRQRLQIFNELLPKGKDSLAVENGPNTVSISRITDSKADKVEGYRVVNTFSGKNGPEVVHTFCFKADGSFLQGEEVDYHQSDSALERSKLGPDEADQTLRAVREQIRKSEGKSCEKADR